MSNLQRGEISTTLGGKKRVLCLTLGALAELESKLIDDDIISFTDRLTEGHIKAGDLIHLLGAALRGGGETITDEEVSALMPEGGFGEAIELAARLIAAAFGTNSASDTASETGSASENKKKESTAASHGKQ